MTMSFASSSHFLPMLRKFRGATITMVVKLSETTVGEGVRSSHKNVFNNFSLDRRLQIFVGEEDCVRTWTRPVAGSSFILFQGPLTGEG